MYDSVHNGNAFSVHERTVSVNSLQQHTIAVRRTRNIQV